MFYYQVLGVTIYIFFYIFKNRIKSLNVSYTQAGKNCTSVWVPGSNIIWNSFIRCQLYHFLQETLITDRQIKLPPLAPCNKNLLPGITVTTLFIFILYVLQNSTPIWSIIASKSFLKGTLLSGTLEFPTQLLFWEPSSNGHRNGKHVPCRLSDKPIPSCTGYRNTCFQRDLSKLHHACTSGSFLNPGKWQRALFGWGQTSAVKRHSCGSPRAVSYESCQCFDHFKSKKGLKWLC